MSAGCGAKIEVQFNMGLTLFQMTELILASVTFWCAGSARK